MIVEDIYAGDNNNLQEIEMFSQSDALLYHCSEMSPCYPFCMRDVVDLTMHSSVLSHADEQFPTSHIQLIENCFKIASNLRQVIQVHSCLYFFLPLLICIYLFL